MKPTSVKLFAGLFAGLLAGFVVLGNVRLHRAVHLERAARAVRAVRTDTARSTFDPELDPPGGAFYAAWSLYVLAEYVRAAGPEEVEESVLTLFREECDRFVAALGRSETPFLQSYPSSAWPRTRQSGSPRSASTTRSSSRATARPSNGGV